MTPWFLALALAADPAPARFEFADAAGPDGTPHYRAVLLADKPPRPLGGAPAPAAGIQFGLAHVGSAGRPVASHQECVRRKAAGPSRPDDRLVLPAGGDGTSDICRLQAPPPDDRLDGGERQLRVVRVLSSRVTFDLRETPQEGLPARQLVIPIAFERRAERIPDGSADHTSQESSFQVGFRLIHEILCPPIHLGLKGCTRSRVGRGPRGPPEC